MEVANNTGYTITNVAYEHCCTGVSTVTGLLATLSNNSGDTPPLTFSTAKGESDYWFISFIDQNNNLITGQLQEDFHQPKPNESTVEISLNPTTFTVTIAGKPYSATYDQKKV